jgi:hypothetical protein
MGAADRDLARAGAEAAGGGVSGGAFLPALRGKAPSEARRMRGIERSEMAPWNSAHFESRYEADAEQLRHA